MRARGRHPPRPECPLRRAAFALLLAACPDGGAPEHPADPAALPAAPADPCPAAGPFAAGWTTGLRVAGQDRAVYTLLPAAPAPGAEPAAGPPLFIAFNGTGEDGARFARRAGLQDFADRGFLVLAPSSAANGQLWPVWDGLRPRGHEDDPNPDLALFDALLACALAHHGVDQRRVYAGGHSAGGIFTNHLVQRRSAALAGVIVASGLYSQTSPAAPAPLDPLTVIITWGGDADRWSGRAGAAVVKDISFAVEAAVAGQAYAASPGVDLWSCRGEDLGHVWLDALNPWMIDALLARPKGAPPADGLAAGALPGWATCARGPAAPPPPEGLRCPASEVPGCQHACQQIADGAVSNRTVGPVLRRELRALGFGDGGCAPCVAACEARAGHPDDAAALACWSARPPVDLEVHGIQGALPLIDAIDACCGPRQAGPFCGALCGALRGNLAARSYVPGCAAG